MCFGAVRGVQTGARRASENTRVCGVLNKGKGAGSRQPLAVSRRCLRIAHCLFPTRASIGHTHQLPRENDVPHDTLRRYQPLPHAGGGDLLTKVVATTEIFHLRRVQRVEFRMGKHPDGRPRGSVCALVTTPACAVPPEVLEGGCELSEFNTS